MRREIHRVSQRKLSETERGVGMCERGEGGGGEEELAGRGREEREGRVDCGGEWRGKRWGDGYGKDEEEEELGERFGGRKSERRKLENGADKDVES